MKSEIDRWTDRQTGRGRTEWYVRCVSVIGRCGRERARKQGRRRWNGEERRGQQGGEGEAREGVGEGRGKGRV